MVKTVSYFFDTSPKRMQFFQNNLKSFLEVEYKRLKDICRNRWVERIDGLDRFEEVFRTIWSVLKQIRKNEVIENFEGNTNEGDEMANEIEINEEGEGQDDKSETERYDENPTFRSDAETLMNACSSFRFIVALIVTRRVLAYTKQAKILLQRAEMDIVKAYDMIAILPDTIQDVRNNGDEYHNKWLSVSVKLAAAIGEEASMPEWVVCRKIAPMYQQLHHKNITKQM